MQEQQAVVQRGRGGYEKIEEGKSLISTHPICSDGSLDTTVLYVRNLSRIRMPANVPVVIETLDTKEDDLQGTSRCQRRLARNLLVHEFLGSNKVDEFLQSRREPPVAVVRGFSDLGHERSVH